jgi:tRNA-dihydrouridine synthase
MFYSGKADWNLVKDIKDKLNIPVIGGGDIFSAGDAVNMINKTGCDAVMVARGAMGNPWIFRDYNHLLSGKEPIDVTISDKREMMKKHINLLVKYKGEYRAVLEIRKHAAWYAKGEYSASNFKNNVFSCKSIEEILSAIDTLSKKK